MTLPRRRLAIVGGGPAGLSLALHLVHLDPAWADQLVVLERGRYPRDKICAGMVADRARRSLARIGISLEVPGVQVNAISVGIGGGLVTVREPGLGAVVARAALDHELAVLARRRGIELREGARVVAVERADRGVRVLLERGEAQRAEAVVGADGVGSVVRRCLGLDRRGSLARAIEVLTPPAPGDPPADVIHFDFGQRDLDGYVWDFPGPAGAPGAARLVCRGVYCVAQRGPRSLRRRLEQHLVARGLDPAAHRPRQSAQRWFDPAAPISAPRALLIGEAAGIDVVTGEGIPQAIAYGAEAAAYLAERLGERGAPDFDDWLPRVRRAALGRRLRVRHASAALFFGPRRAEMEQLILRSPAVLRLWARDFAGQPLGPAALLRGVGQAVPLALRHGPTLLRALGALGWPLLRG